MAEFARVTRYLSGEEDELSELWAYEAPQQDVYARTLNEVRIELEVNLETGNAEIVAINKFSVSPPIPA